MTAPTRTELARALETAQVELTAKERECSSAQEHYRAANLAFDDAEKRYDSRGSKTNAGLYDASRRDRDRADRILERANEASEKARAAMREAEKEIGLFDYRVDLDLVKEHSAIAPLVDALVSLALGPLHSAVVDLVASQQSYADVHSRNLERAGRLGLAAELAASVKATSLSDVRLLVQRKLAEARAAADLPDVSRWIASASTDWRLRDLNAEQREEAERLRQVEQENLVHDVGAAHGRVQQQQQNGATK
jgi:hypothetical protein